MTNILIIFVCMQIQALACYVAYMNRGYWAIGGEIFVLPLIWLLLQMIKNIIED